LISALREPLKTGGFQNFSIIMLILGTVNRPLRIEGPKVRCGSFKLRIAAGSARELNGSPEEPPPTIASSSRTTAALPSLCGVVKQGKTGSVSRSPLFLFHMGLATNEIAGIYIDGFF
jgi:hypothetical protein